MFPFFWLFWAPRNEYPLSGDVTQDIVLDHFFSSITPKAGKKQIEREAFSNASYGKQLGILSELVLSLVDSEHIGKKQAADAKTQLEEIYTDIEKIKKRHLDEQVIEAKQVLQKLREENKEAFEDVLKELQRSKD